MPDSLFAIYHYLCVRLPMFKVLHLILYICERGLTVKVVWIPLHAGIRGNEMADSVAQSAYRLPFTVHCGVPREDLFSVFNLDFESWPYLFWPFDLMFVLALTFRKRDGIWT